MAKIAIIEDDQRFRRCIEIKFEAEGFVVETAENGRVGLELIENMRPDIVLLDIMMPEMNGDALLDKLRKSGWGSRHEGNHSDKHGRTRST